MKLSTSLFAGVVWVFDSDLRFFSKSARNVVFLAHLLVIAVSNDCPQPTCSSPFSWVVMEMICMNSMKTCPSITSYFMKNSFSDIRRKCILPNIIRAGTALIIFGKIHLGTVQNFS